MKPSDLLRLSFPILCLLSAAPRPAQAAAPKYDPEKLRSLVALPKMNLQMDFQLSTDLGFTFGGEPLDLAKIKPPAERVAELRKETGGGVGDAERYAELGRLYEKLEDQAQARSARNRAAELYRSQVKDNPKQGWPRTQLGRVLVGLEQKAEGERLLRDAVALAPEDWRCSTALGGFLAGQAYQVFGFTNSAAMYAEIQRGRRAPASDGPVSPDQRAKARALRDEAQRCYDQAVSAAPRELGAYQARAGFRWAIKPFLDSLVEPERATESSARQRFLGPDVMEDLKQAARLTTDDAYAIGLAATMEAMSTLSNEGLASKDLPERGFWPFLPEATRVYVAEAMARLEQLGRKEDKVVAGGALAALGGLQFLVRHDLAAAETNLRRSTRLRPAANAPWEILSILLVQGQRWPELATLAEERVKSGDSARLRFGLAKVYEKLNRPTDVESQLDAAVKLSPNHFLANTGRAALRLQRARSDADLAEVGETMARLKQSSFDAAPMDEQMAFEYLHGLFFGLAGNREEAASHFRRLREASPGEPNYREAYDALGL